MKYDTETALKEIMERSENVKQKRRSLQNAVLAGISGVLMAALIAVIAFVPDWSEEHRAGTTAMGSFMLSTEAGGYILAAVIAFSIGVLITIICIRIRDKKKKED